ncbi:MAG TPA: outer membrane beta-barrel protein [Gammaproteobacteria bacterium]|jgi:OOP family OmpA-OmpF porin
MYKKLLIAGLLLSAGLPLVASADNFQGWYLDGMLGVSSYGNSQDDEDSIQSGLAQQGTEANVHVDDNPGAIGIGFGYHFNPYFALEANYLDLGDATSHIHFFAPVEGSSTEHLDASGGSLDAIGLIPLSERVSLFGKVGAFDYHLDDTVDADFPVQHQFPDANATTWDLGAGVEIHFDRGLGMRAGYTSYQQVGDSKTGKQNIGLGYAQLYFNF